MTIQAYIDDSGVKGTDAVFVLAGFIGRAENWAQFSDAWKAHLKRPPSVRYIKMNEAAKLDGEFRFWRPHERDEKLRGCAEIIKSFRPDKGIYFINDLVAWDQIVFGNAVKLLNDPHFLSFYGMIAAVCNEAMDCSPDERLDIIFDNHAILGPRIALWYPVVKEMYETLSPAGLTPKGLTDISSVMPVSPMFRDDREFLPLQAADILAWLLRCTFRDRVPGLESEWRRSITGFEWLAEEILPHIPPSDYSTVWGHERIARMQEMSREQELPPELLAKWREQLGIRPPKQKKQKHRK